MTSGMDRGSLSMDHIGGTASRSREEWNDLRCDGAPPGEETLDPEDWNTLRTLGHQMLDDMFDSIATVRDRARLAADARSDQTASPRARAV